MSGIADIDTSGAAAAIEAAGGLEQVTRADALGTEAAATPQGQPGATPQDAGLLRDPVSGRIVSRPTETPGTPDASQETPFTSIDPNALPEELKPIYKSLQADYTRKTQEAAALRKQYESYGDPNELAQAVELYHSLQNPVNWPALYEDLKKGMEQMGMSPQAAAQAAQQEVQAQQVQQQQQGQWQNDPELQPIQEMLSPLQKELQELRAEMKQRQEAEQQERLTQQMVNHIQRQESQIRAANPNYQDEDYDALYALAPFFGGDLLQAQEKYEAIATSRLQRFLDAKQGQSSTVPEATPGGGVHTEQPSGGWKDLDEAHKAAMESLRMMEAAD